MPTSGMLIISMCLRLNPHPRSSLTRMLFGCAGVGGVAGGVLHLGFSPVHENRFETLRLTSEFCSYRSLNVTFASSPPNVGMTPVFVPERK